MSKAKPLNKSAAGMAAPSATSGHQMPGEALTLPRKKACPA